jgi:hypothetical protein
MRAARGRAEGESPARNTIWSMEIKSAMSEADFRFWNFVANVAVAVGTLAVPFVAGFGESLRAPSY